MDTLATRLRSGWHRPKMDCLATWLLWVAVTSNLSAAVLELNVVDELGVQTPCRVLIRSVDKSYLPEGAVVLPLYPDKWFYSDGSTRLELPEGEYKLRVEKGLEFSRVSEPLAIHSPALEHQVVLKRWVDMRSQGYVCSENHIHVDTRSLAPMLVAEGLDFGSSLTWWRGPDPLRLVPEGSGNTRLLTFAGKQVPTSIYDAELEYDWGAAYLQKLPQALPLVAEPGRPNLDYVRYAANAGATVHYQGGWSREVLLDSLFGCVHIVNICNNNFGLHRFQPRARYSNLLQVNGFPNYPETDLGMMQLNTDSYYRLLNCGIRLAAGAGTASGVKKAPVGYNRSYVRMEGVPSIDEFHLAWRAGRNFVTNGPMIFLESDDGALPGDTIHQAEPRRDVALRVKIISDQPLSTVQLVRNGHVVFSQDLHGQLSADVRHSLLIDKSCWIAARCTAYDDLLSGEELSAYINDGNANGPISRPSRLRFAHTSPLYVRLGESPPCESAAVREGLLMLAALSDYAREHCSPLYLAEFLTEIDRAAQILNQRLAASY